jgi:hypothetical protein
MPPDQFGKGFLRALPLVIPQQVHVAHIGHLTIYCRCEAKSGIFFYFLPPRRETGNKTLGLCLYQTPTRSDNKAVLKPPQSRRFA